MSSKRDKYTGPYADFGKRIRIPNPSESEPDKYCMTTPDGGCNSTDPRCMHNKPAPKAEPEKITQEMAEIILGKGLDNHDSPAKMYYMRLAQGIYDRLMEVKPATQQLKCPDHADGVHRWVERGLCMGGTCTEVSVKAQPAVKMHKMTHEDGCIGWFVDHPDFYCDIEQEDGRWSVFFRDKASNAEGYGEAQPATQQPAGEPVGHLDGLDANADFMSMALRRQHIERNSSTPNKYTIPVFTTPQPATQSDSEIRNLLLESRKNFERQFGYSSAAAWVYNDLAELLCNKD